MFEHIGFPSLERYPNTFFADQIAHLEQAIIESPVTAIGGKSKSMNDNFNDTQQGKLLIWMRSHSQYKTIREICDHVGKHHKQTRKYLTDIEGRGIPVDRRTNKNVMEIRII